MESLHPLVARPSVLVTQSLEKRTGLNEHTNEHTIVNEKATDIVGFLSLLSRRAV